MLHAVVMSGGTGTRFWPQSRRSRPKQLLPLAGSRSMIRETVDRIRPWITAQQTWVVTNKLQQKATAEQLPEVPSEQLLIEPQGRNTAPCIGLAAISLLARDPDATMLVMPADHVIQPAEAFHQAVERAERLVEQHPDRFVLFGVPPAHASTGFGYIERGESDPDADGVFRVESFREKPVQSVAEEYLASGRFYWNCGIFVWKAQAILDALGRSEPKIHEQLETLRPAIGTSQWHNKLQVEFPLMRSISIDHAVLEPSASEAGGRNVYVIEAPFEWDDVGSWLSLARRLPPDDDGNVVRGTHCGIETANCIISSDEGHLIGTIGVEDLVIVHTPDATLVARREDEQAVRRLIERLKEKGHDKYL
jgi:mannose-1-phosphate guanylyltransferase